MIKTRPWRYKFKHYVAPISDFITKYMNQSIQNTEFRKTFSSSRR